MDKMIIKNVTEKVSIKFTETLRVNASFTLGYDDKTGKLSLLGKDGAVLSEIDLPIEKILTKAYYDDNSKELVLNFENSNEVRIPIDFTDEIESAINEFESRVNTQFSQLQESVNTSFQEVNQKIDDLEKEINENVNKEIDNLGQEITNLEQTINENINQQIENLSGEINALEETINESVNQNIEQLNSKIDGLEEEINTNINSQVETLNQKVDTLEDTINNNIGKQVEALNESINETNQDLQGYKESNAQNLSDLETNLEQKIVENVEQINSDIEEINNNKVDKVEGKQLSTNDLTNELLQLLQDKYTKEETNKLVNDLDVDLQKQIDDIKLILTTDDVDFDTLQELVNALKNNVASINDIFTELSKKANKDEIPTKVSDLENDLGYLTQHQDISGKAEKTYVDEELEKKVNNEDFETYKDGIDLRFEDIKPQGIIDVGTADDIFLKRGTIVPKDKLFNTVYVNTSLTKNKVNDILLKLNSYYKDASEIGFSGFEYYLIYNLVGYGSYMMIAFRKAGYYAIGYFNHNHPLELIFAGKTNFLEYSVGNSNDFVGWNSNFNGVISVKGTEHFYTDPTVYQNEKLINLVSITPFKDPNEQVLYRVPTNVVGVYNFYWIKNNTRYKMVSNSDVNIIETDLREVKNTINVHTTQIENLNTEFNNFVNESEIFAEELNEKINSIKPDAIVDVNSINELNKGTVVPNTGATSKVYFNTNLDIQSVVDIMKTLEYPLQNAMGYGEEIYASLITTYFENVMFIKLGEIYGIFLTEQQEFIFISEPVPNLDINFSGWYSDFEGSLEFVGTQFVNYVEDLGSIGYQNEKLTKIMSITPFQSENILYRLNEWKGTPVSTSGMINNVYLNTNLSHDEVVSICKNLDYVEVEGYMVCPVFTDSTMTNILSIVKFNELDSGLSAYYITFEIEGNTVDVFIGIDYEIDSFPEEVKNDFGWQESGIININIENMLSTLAPMFNFTPVNDKISNLISSTPFVAKEPKLYHIKNGETYEIGSSANLEERVEKLENPTRVYAKDKKGNIFPVYAEDEENNIIDVYYEEKEEEFLTKEEFQNLIQEKVDKKDLLFTTTINIDEYVTTNYFTVSDLIKKLVEKNYIDSQNTKVYHFKIIYQGNVNYFSFKYDVSTKRIYNKFTIFRIKDGELYVFTSDKRDKIEQDLVKYVFTTRGGKIITTDNFNDYYADTVYDWISDFMSDYFYEYLSDYYDTIYDWIYDWASDNLYDYVYEANYDFFGENFYDYFIEEMDSFIETSDLGKVEVESYVKYSPSVWQKVSENYLFSFTIRTANEDYLQTPFYDFSTNGKSDYIYSITLKDEYNSIAFQTLRFWVGGGSSLSYVVIGEQETTDLQGNTITKWKTYDGSEVNIKAIIVGQQIIKKK